MFQKKQEWIENEKTEIFKRQIRHHKHFMMLNKNYVLKAEDLYVEKQ